MSEGVTPSVVVYVEAEIAKLRSDMARAQEVVDKGTKSMAATVERNNPFKMLHEAMRAGGVAIGIHTVTSALDGMSRALDDINAGGSVFESFLYNAPLGLGNLARSASDFVVKIMGWQADFAKTNPTWDLAKSEQARQRTHERTMDDLRSRWSIENATDDVAKSKAQLESDLRSNQQIADDQRRALDEELGALRSKLNKPNYDPETLRRSPFAIREMKQYEEELKRIAEIEKRRTKEIEDEQSMRDTIAEKQDDARRQRIRDSYDRRYLNEERSRLDDQLSAAREELAGLKSNKGTESITSAIGAFTIAQRGSENNAQRMLELQEQIKKLLEEMKDIQKKQAEIGGPN